MTNLTQIFLKIYFHKVTIGSCSKIVLMFYTNIFRGYNMLPVDITTMLSVLETTAEYNLCTVTIYKRRP